MDWIGDDFEGAVFAETVEQVLAQVGCIGFCGSGVEIDFVDMA